MQVTSQPKSRIDVLDAYGVFMPWAQPAVVPVEVPRETAWTVVQTNTGLVYSIVKRYCHHTNDFEDLVQEGLLGLYEAARRFDPTMQTAFSTYAYTWITKYVLGYYQQRSDDAQNDQYDEVRDSPKLTTGEQQFVREELRSDLQRHLRSLDEVTRLTIFMRWLAADKATLSEIAGALNVTPERVRQIEADGLKKLNQLLSRRKA